MAPLLAWSDVETAKMHWREVLAESNKEMLLELANNVTSGSSTGGAKSLEDIALAVADRILAQPSAVKLLHGGQADPHSPFRQDGDTTP